MLKLSSTMASDTGQVAVLKYSVRIVEAEQLATFNLVCQIGC